MAKRTPKSDIKVWLARQDKPQEWLALKLGISAPFLSLVLSGYRKPSPDLIKAIKKLTGVNIAPPVTDPTELTEAR